MTRGPLYVNHDRAEPVPGDVVRVESGGEVYTDVYLPRRADDPSPWVSLEHDDFGGRYPTDEAMCQRPSQGQNRLLVDGETGQVVTP